MKSTRKALLVFCVAVIAPALLAMLFRFIINRLPDRNYKTIDAIAGYAKGLPEFILPETNDWENPQFVNFYKNRTPYLLHFTQSVLNLKDHSPWNPSFFHVLLHEATQQNTSKGLSSERDIVFLNAKPSDKIIIFGDIHGAFHSMVRNLANLKEQGMITNDLIVRDDVFLIFNGDVIDRSAYNIDTLILITLLMSKNQGNVIYIAGNHESNEYWLNYGLRGELYYRAEHLSAQDVPFRNQVNEFFQSLPVAVYIRGERDTTDIMRISFFDREKLPYKESELDSSIFDTKNRISYLAFSKAPRSEFKFDNRAVIKTEDWQLHNRIKHGLGLLDQVSGATNWAVLSSPTIVQRLYLDFNDDAYVELQIPDQVANGMLTLVHQDTRFNKGYVKDPPRNIVSGGPEQPASKLKSIDIASSLSLIRGLPTMGKQIRAGISTAVNKYNVQDGGNRPLARLYIENDDYVPKMARQNTVEFLRRGIRYFIMPLGTPTLTACLDILKENNAVAFFPQSGSSLLRKKDLKQLIHYRAAYEDESRALIQVMQREYNALKYALFYQDDSFGQGPFHAAVEELKKRGIKEILALPYTRGSVSYEKQVEALKLFSPDALGFFSTATAAVEFIRQAGLNNLLSTQLFGISVIGAVEFRRHMSHLGLKTLLSSPVPNPNITTVPIARAFQEEMNANNNIIDTFAFEGYIGARLLLHAVEKTGKKNPSAQDSLKVLESFKNVQYLGLSLNFNPETRSLAKSVWVETDQNTPWLEIAID